MHTLMELAEALDAGRTTSRALTEGCLAAIADPAGEGARTFIAVRAEAALAQADASDALRRTGHAPGPFAGIPVSVKDLFDIAGQITAAGSRVLANAPPATAHAPVVARLLGAGFVLVGRTNMTEFAFSGIGINPHYGTPANPWDRVSRRIPGGSSSGAAVSVADGMAFAGLGTDTGGSCRVPAALCGIVGYKPTARRVPTAGAVPLSCSLDSVGPLANTVRCCAAVDAVLANEPVRPVPSIPVAGLRLAVPDAIACDDLDETVAASFQRALATLSAAGVRIETVAFPALGRIRLANAAGGIAPAEAFAWHRSLMAGHVAEYDPRVLSRIEMGRSMTAADYIDLLAARIAIGQEMDAATARFDALVMPTCPLVPPPIDSLADDAAFSRANMLMLRNPSIGNFLDRCAISLPCHAPGDAPVGLMLMGETMGDARLFAVAASVEEALARR